MIVSMNREMQDVDTTLGDIGRRCNPRLMEKKYTHYNQIKGDVDEKGILLFTSYKTGQTVQTTDALLRCGETNTWGPASSTPSLHDIYLSTPTTARIPLVGGETYGHVSPSVQHPIQTDDRATVCRKPAQAAGLPSECAFGKNRQTALRIRINSGRYNRGLSRPLPSFERLFRRCHTTFP